MRRLLYSFSSVLLIFTLVIVSLHIASAQNQVTVVPNQLANIAGNETGGVFSCFPFPSLRAQAVFLGSEVGGGEIISLVNRSEPFGAAYGPVTLPNVRVVLSTTTETLDTLSTTFEDNTGPDAVVVFEGDITISAPECNTSPCPFVSGLVDFQNSFIFNPANGNLLVDVTVPSCPPDVTNGDMTDQFPEVMRAIVSPDFESESGIETNIVLITQFTTDPSALFRKNVPTLSTWGLVLTAGVLGLVGIIVLRRSKVVS